MSSKNFTKREKGISSPKPGKAGFIKSLNKIIELHGGNESAVARRLGVPPQYINRWREGKGPTKAALKNFALTFQTPEVNLLEGVINEAAARYERPLDMNRQRLQESFNQLIGDDYVIKEIEAMFKILKDLRFARSAKVDREQVLLYLGELSDEERQRVLDDVVERGEELDQAGHIREAIRPPGQTLPFKKKDSPERDPVPDSEEKIKTDKN